MNIAPRSLLIALLAAACSQTDVAVTTPSPTPTAAPTAEPNATPRPDVFELAKRYDAASPAELAKTIVRAERGITRAGAARWAPAQQAAYRQLVGTPDWRDDVYSRLPQDLRGVARANVTAGAELRLLTAPREELPPWQIIEPPPADELRAHYDAASKEFEIDWTYLAAIHLVETRMGRIRGDSVAGAKGPMQFMPSTWAAYGEGNIEDPRDAIRAAARYLKASGAPTDMSGALFAYNRSNHYVRAIELYAERMSTDETAYAAYYHWDVYYRTTNGDALLYVGWPSK